MRFFLIVFLFLAGCGSVAAQGCGPNNPNCVVPTAPAGTCDSRAASTLFTCNAISGGSSPGTAKDIPIYNSGGNGFVDSGVSISGVLGNVLNSQILNYTLQTSDCGKTVQAGTGSTGFFTITVPSVSGFPAVCVVQIVNGDTARGKALSGDPGCAPVYHILWPTQVCIIGIVNGAWAVINPPRRWSISATVTFFADSTNGSDSGSTDCLATGTAACATITHAAAIICDNLFLNANQVNITPPNGANQVENVTLCNYTPGSGAAGTVSPQILGNPASPSSYSIAPASGVAITGVNISTPWTINGLALNSPTTQVLADINSLIYLTNVRLLVGTFYSLDASYTGKIEAIGPVTIVGSGTGGGFATTQYGGQFLQQGVAFTCTGSPTFTQFANSQDGGFQNWTGATFSSCGSVTGARFSATTGAGIETNGGGANFFPGNSPGTTTNPGWYN